MLLEPDEPNRALLLEPTEIIARPGQEGRASSGFQWVKAALCRPVEPIRM